MPKEYFKLSEARSINEFKPGARVHFVGVAGVGMAPLAVAMQKLGYKVSGSDKEFYEPMGSFLRDSGVKCLSGYSAENFKDVPDLVVIGNAISYGNPEIDVVEQRKYPYSFFPKLVSEVVIAQRHSIVVCGTHGKSTTTAMIASMLAALGQDPSFFVGAMPLAFESGLIVGTGKYSVVEGDEYDSAFFAKLPKFKFYKPKTCIVTNIEFDHADIYPTLDSILKEFDDLVAMLPADGQLICCLDCKNVRGRVNTWRQSCKAKIITYGKDSQADYVLVKSEQFGSSQNVHLTSKQLGEIDLKLPLFGEHNAKNALAALIAFNEMGFQTAEIKEAFQKYRGLKRRQEVLVEKSDLVLVEDFAHHPTEVRETIAAMKRAFPNHALWAVFEPRTNTSRRKVFQEEYITAFTQAQRVFLSDVAKRAIDQGHELLHVDELAENIAARGVPANYSSTPDELKVSILSEISKSKQPKLVLLMSNGGFGGLPKLLRDELETKKP